MARRVVAAFDFDGTVSDREAVASFCALVLGRPRLGLTFARNAHLGFAALRDRSRRDRFKAALARATFAGRSVSDVETLAKAFAETRMSTLRPLMTDRISWHQEQGHETVLASASFEQYLQPIAAALNIDTVLGTKLAIEDGVFTGELDGPNMRSAAKADALRAHAGEAELWAYGNSSDDYPMFELAQHAFLITRTGAIMTIS